MRKQNQTHAIFVFVLFMVSFIPVSLNAEAGKADNVFAHLQTLDALVNPPLTWDLVLNKKSPPGKYQLRERINRQAFTLRSAVKGVENFCAVHVLNTVMHLKLILY
jgi:hypothetical protein